MALTLVFFSDLDELEVVGCSRERFEQLERETASPPDRPSLGNPLEHDLAFGAAAESVNEAWQPVFADAEVADDDNTGCRDHLPRVAKSINASTEALAAVRVAADGVVYRSRSGTDVQNRAAFAASVPDSRLAVLRQRGVLWPEM